LEDYLARALEPAQAAAFVEHCADCLACRHEVEAAREVDRLLVEACQSDVPSNLAERIRRRCRSAARSRLMSQAAWAAAACVGIGLLVAWWTMKQAELPRVGLRVESAIETQTKLPAPALVSLPPDSPYIALSEKSGNPHVTIVWLYRLQRVERDHSRTKVDDRRKSERTSDHEG
jgi:hypothetical protein